MRWDWTENMLQLHFYSNHAGRLVLKNESHNWWSIDTYPLESIKEFEQVSEAWKACLADLLRRGLKYTAIAFIFIWPPYHEMCIILISFILFFWQKRMIRWSLWNFSDFIKVMTWYQHRLNWWFLILNCKWRRHSMHSSIMVCIDLNTAYYGM